jgi:hypothetical protein
MSNSPDFEQAWQAKFARCLNEVAGEEIRKRVMLGSEELSDNSDRQQVIDWTKRAMERLDALVDEKRRGEIMTGCACQYPKPDLQAARRAYESTGNIDESHRILQEQFESFLRNTLGLSDEMIAEVTTRGWGLAGTREGNRIVATKIPKSEHLLDYLSETDREKKRAYYCHCPRVREILKTAETISQTYCTCGAGFYKGIWEEILQAPVEVEVLESVLQGGEVCRIAIHLP